MAWAHLLNAHQLRLSHLQPTDSEYTHGHLEKVTDYLPMQNIFNAHLQPCKHLIHNILQCFTEGQKFVQGDRQGTAFLQRNQ